MTDLMLGRLPALMPAGLKELGFYAAGPLPKPPAMIDVPAVLDWGMDGNDAYGDCGVAGVDHGFKADAAATSEAEQFPSEQQIIDYYLTYTKGHDTGVVLSQFLAYVRKEGFFGHKIAAYAPVGVHDIPTLHNAIAFYDFAYCGIEVTQQMMQDFQNGKPWTLESLLSPVEGGHCIPLVGYTDEYLYAVTWGKVQPISYPAWHFMSSEAWAVITGELEDAKGDGRGVNLDALTADLDKLAA